MNRGGRCQTGELGVSPRPPPAGNFLSAMNWLPPPTHKHCTRCGGWLPVEAFHANRKLSSGLNSWCKACQVEGNRQWRADNPSKVAEANAARRVREREFMCVECGDPFRSRRVRLTCGEKCRRERHRRFDRVRDHASRKEPAG
jgi:hypothetical protein